MHGPINISLLAVLLRYYTLFTQGVYKMLGRNWGVSFPHQDKETVCTGVCPHTRSFQGTASTFARSQSFWLLSIGTFKIPTSFGSNLRLRDPSTGQFLMPARLFCNSSGIFDCGDSPWSDVPMRALVRVEDILTLVVNSDLKTIRTQQLLNWKRVS